MIIINNHEFKIKLNQETINKSNILRILQKYSSHSLTIMMPEQLFDKKIVNDILIIVDNFVKLRKLIPKYATKIDKQYIDLDDCFDDLDEERIPTFNDLIFKNNADESNTYLEMDSNLIRNWKKYMNTIQFFEFVDNDAIIELCFDNLVIIIKNIIGKRSVEALLEDFFGNYLDFCDHDYFGKIISNTCLFRAREIFSKYEASLKYLDQQTAYNIMKDYSKNGDKNTWVKLSDTNNSILDKKNNDNKNRVGKIGNILCDIVEINKCIHNYTSGLIDSEILEFMQSLGDIYISGGFLAGCLINDVKSWSDIDIWINSTDAVQKGRLLFEKMISKESTYDNDHYFLIAKNNTVTFMYRKTNIQFIMLDGRKPIQQNINEFDIDAMKVYTDGKELYATVNCIVENTNKVITSCYDTSFQRIVKMMLKGYTFNVAEKDYVLSDIIKSNIKYGKTQKNIIDYDTFKKITTNNDDMKDEILNEARIVKNKFYHPKLSDFVSEVTGITTRRVTLAERSEYFVRAIFGDVEIYYSHNYIELFDKLERDFKKGTLSLVPYNLACYLIENDSKYKDYKYDTNLTELNNILCNSNLNIFDNVKIVSMKAQKNISENIGNMLERIQSMQGCVISDIFVESDDRTIRPVFFDTFYKVYENIHIIDSFSDINDNMVGDMIVEINDKMRSDHFNRKTGEVTESSYCYFHIKDNNMRHKLVDMNIMLDTCERISNNASNSTSKIIKDGMHFNIEDDICFRTNYDSNGLECEIYVNDAIQRNAKIEDLKRIIDIYNKSEYNSEMSKSVRIVSVITPTPSSMRKKINLSLVITQIHFSFWTELN